MLEDLAALVAELLLLVGLAASRRRRSLPASGSTLKAIGPGELRRGRELDGLAVVGERGGAVDHLADLLVELLDAGQPGAGHGLVGARSRARMSPASACSGLSTGMAAMVVQFGLATMPLGRSASAWGFTSDTTSGTSGSMRHADELSITTAPAAAKRGARAREPVAPAENRAMSRPAESAVAASSTDDLGALPRQRAPGRAGRGEVAQLVDGEGALVEHAAHDPADLTGGTDDADAHGPRLPAAPPALRLPRRHSSAQGVT